MSRPQSDEYAEYYGRYIDRVPDGDVVAMLESQGNATQELLASIGEEKAGYRYEPGKWSIKQVVGHITDSERVFAYRLVAFARGEKQPLPGFDQDEYMETANFDASSLGDLAKGLASTRQATLTLVRSLDDEAWSRRGIASDNPVSAR
ncbi:MAG TPA: DinB family protein, partial [Thermoanaerobaculia bacterium]|nr:DinB family protein [Thermoanaerobaculia bacterium]